MRDTGIQRFGAIRRGLLALAMLAVTAGSASAQLIFDGNILFNNRVNNPGQTLNDQSGSPQTARFLRSPARRRASWYCAWFVSWYSSTRT